MATLSLSLFGSFTAEIEEQQLDHFRTNKVQALLIYLAIEAPTIHQRESLMELLWPGMPRRSAQVNLRQTVYQLGKDVPDMPLGNNRETAVSLLLSDRKTIQLNPDYPLTNNVATFSRLLQRSQRHQHSDLLTCPDCQTWLTEATGLYQGDFLTDFSLYDSNTYEAWSQAKREGLRRQMLDALDTLTHISITRADYMQAEKMTRRQLEIDNYRESATRQLMRVLALNGRRSEALTVYARCEQLLATELGMSPAVKTTALYEQIRSGDLSLARPQTKGIRGYELKEELGAGAFGTVHRALQKGVSREVAIKIIKPQYANQPQFIRRFEAEAQIVARLEHPYIVPLYDYWREPDGAYLVMRWLRGGNLGDVLAGRPYDPQTAVTLIDQIAAALHTAHRQGIVHRDVKPSNILLDEEGNGYLSDFGIARELGRNGRLTATNELVGSPAYIAPEQLKGEDVTAATDIYSLGLVLYELLTGSQPFSTTSIVELIQKQVSQPLPFIHSQRPELPPTIDDVIQQATAKRAADRFPDTLSLAAAFRRALQGEQPSVARPAIALVAEADIVNPYQGLRPFQENDAARFFGRTALVKHLLTRLSPSPFEGEGQGGGRFLAVVGPSGSGKSSVVKAGLIPALREGALPGSENWFVAEMVPGTHPLEELEAALMRVAVNPPASLLEPLQKDERGLTRVLKRVLPHDTGQTDSSQLLLLIDQFEELFTLVTQEADRVHFINNLLTALNEPNSRLLLVLTLRADFYDRPLHYAEFGALMKQQTEIVLPLTPAELEQAIVSPVASVGVMCEPGLVTAIITDVNEQPGALPLVQYALTELFERRDGRSLTLTAYQEIGGITGALSRRADEIYAAFAEADQEATRQLFLRLITLGEGVEDTRRRVKLSELEGLAVNGKPSSVDGNPITDHRLPITAYGNHRLLTFDNDPLTREPTVEVAHEALLREWGRLRDWLAESRHDVRLQRLLTNEVQGWQTADQDPSYLLRGARLTRFEEWATQTTIALTQDEQTFLQASITARQQRQAEEEARQQRELETAHQLAATEHQRAQEQAQAAQNLRRRAVYLGVALIVAVALAVTALLFSHQSRQNAALAAAAAAEALTNADLAATREAEAVANAQAAATQEALAQQNASLAATQEAESNAQRILAEAEANTRATAEAVAIQEQAEAQRQAELAQARELAASGLVALEEDPERSILLALRSLDLVYTPEGEEMLRQSMMASRVRLTIPKTYQNLGEVIYSPDGSTLIGVEDDGSNSFITIWDATTGEILQSLSCNTTCTGGSFSSDGNLLAVGDNENNIVIVDLKASWAAGSIQIQHQLVGHTGELGYLVFSPDNTRLASTSWDKTLRLWDLMEGQLLYSIEEPGIQWYFTVPDFSPDGNLVTVSGFVPGTEVGTRVFDTNTGDLLLSLPTDQRWPSFTTDGTRLITRSSGDQRFYIWDVATSLATSNAQELYNFGRASTRPFGVNPTSPDNIYMTEEVNVDSDIVLWQLGENGATQAIRLSGHAPQFLVLTIFHPDGDRLATFGEDGIRVWDISPAGQREFLTYKAHESTVYYLALNQVGTQIATASFDGTAKLWSAESDVLLQEFIGHEAVLRTVDFSPDGLRLVTSSDDRTARVWDTTTGQELAILNASDEGEIGAVFLGVMSAKFSPDGRYIVTAAVDGTVRLWDAETYEQLQSEIINPREGSESPWGVTLATFSPDSTLLAAVTDSGPVPAGLVKVWEIATGDVLLEEVGGTRLFGVNFSPDGRYLAVSGPTDVPIQMWDIESGEQLLNIPPPDGIVRGIYFTEDGRQLITPAGSALHFWDAANGDLLRTLNIPQPFVLSPDGSRLFAGGEDGLVRVYLMNVDELATLARSRLTRSLTEAECQQYLHVAVCPAE